jgi:hypothetical protein
MTLEQQAIKWMAKRIDMLEESLVKADLKVKQWRQVAEFLQDTIDRELPNHEHATRKKGEFDATNKATESKAAD